MSKKYVVSRGFLSVMTGMVGLAAMLGFTLGNSLPDKRTDLEVAREIRVFIEEALEEGQNIEAIKTEATRMARKHAMTVGFGYGDKVGIYKDLGSKQPLILGFDIGDDKASIH